MKRRTLYFKILRVESLKYLVPAVMLVSAVSCSKNQEGEYSVMKGPFRQSVIETGELQAVNASYLIMPRINYIYGYNLKLVGLAEHGKTVSKGDIVIKVDPSSVQKYIIERQESLETERASANKLQAQMTNNLQDLKAQIRNEQASYDIRKLGVQKSGFESAGLRKVMELEFRQAEIRLKKLKRNLELRPKLDSIDFRIQQIKIMQRENEVKAAQEALEKLTVKSPLDGIFVVEQNWNTGQTIKVGDAVYTGEPVAMIPDIRSMKVKGFVQENDIGKIKSGMNVIVRLDALPSVSFHGKISKLGKVCIERDDKKVFPAEVLIAESDLRLKPGMTVSCEYISYESEDEMYVPNNCILEENRHFYIFVRKRGSIRKTEVKTGPSNNTYTVISGDIRKGQSLELPENILTN
jgi:multidrug efflux pump subunit AcrA (membrane-fusion protein)